MSWMELPQVVVMSRESHQSQSECCAPASPGPGGCPLEEGTALHPGSFWEAPLTFQALRRPSRVALRLGGVILEP